METEKSEKKSEREIEYLVESGAVFLPVPGTKTLTRYLPGSTIKLKPRVAARMLLNKGRPLAVVEAERAAMGAASKAAAEAATDLES